MQVINIFDFEYADYWLSSDKTATHIAIVYTVVNGVIHNCGYHLFRDSTKYFIDIFGFRFRKSDGTNTGDNACYIDISSVIPVTYFKPSSSFSRGH